MAYYLSKANKAIVEMLLPKLIDKEEDWGLKTNRPERIESAIRSAYSSKVDKQYSWIKDKWILKVREGEILFNLKQLHMEELKPKAEIIEDPAEFFDVLNILVLQKKDRIDFIRCTLTDDERDNLVNWGKNNKYNITYEEDSILHVERVSSDILKDE